MRRILVVDDEELVLKAVQRMLEVYDHMKITTAKSGEEALEIMENDSPPDLLITDEQMYGMGGLRLISEVKKRYPGIPIIMTGAQSPPHNGADLTLRKPFSSFDFYRAIDKFIAP